VVGVERVEKLCISLCSTSFFLPLFCFSSFLFFLSARFADGSSSKILGQFSIIHRLLLIGIGKCEGRKWLYPAHWKRRIIVVIVKESSQFRGRQLGFGWVHSFSVSEHREI
jgi:hypothetical protein